MLVNNISNRYINVNTYLFFFVGTAKKADTPLHQEEFVSAFVLRWEQHHRL
jgi:hypothetical protein